MGAKPESGITADTQVARIFAWRRGFNAMHLVDLGVRLGLFRALAESPDATPAEIAGRLGLHEPYVRVWCVTAHGFELVDGSDDGRFRLAPHFDTILANSGHPRYLGGYVRLGTEFAAEDFRQLEEAFRSGGSVPFQGRSQAFAQIVADSTAGLQVLSARKILPELPGLKAALDAGGRLLEVGCGTGSHLIQLAKAFPGCHCVGVDIDPTGLAAARAAIAKAGVAERVTIVEGDVGEKIEPASFDAVVMIEVLHEIGPSLRPGVVRSCARALRPRGWLAIIDETYPSTLAETRQREFQFPLQTGFEELLWGNVIPTREEQERLLRDAGFAGEIGRTLIGEGFTVLTVQKGWQAAPPLSTTC